MKIPNKVRYINKKFTNRLMMLIAGRKGSPIGVLHHTGRRSGKRYSIPILAAPTTGGFAFALTYGDHVDWYRNVLATGGATLTWRGRDYQLRSPLSISADMGRMFFPQPWRALLFVMRTADFFCMTIEE
ncbi:MAG TPA: hypothetical protein PKK59_03770 [Anaerolineaceae bacterium]|nr:hypothetical protein [Anaerolineaceae bacterium]